MNSRGIMGDCVRVRFSTQINVFMFGIWNNKYIFRVHGHSYNFILTFRMNVFFSSFSLSLRYTVVLYGTHLRYFSLI